MIGKLRGLISINDIDDFVLVNVNDIYLEVYMMQKDIDTIAQGDRNCAVDIFTKFNKDSFKIFGFLKMIDKLLFEFISDINGVGNKTAILIVNCFSIDDLLLLLKKNQKFSFDSIHGVGKKLSSKILFEIDNKRDKLIKMFSGYSDSYKKDNSIFLDAVAALVSLGVGKNRANAIVDECIRDSSLESNKKLDDLIRLAISKI